MKHKYFIGLFFYYYQMMLPEFLFGGRGCGIGGLTKLEDQFISLYKGKNLGILCQSLSASLTLLLFPSLSLSSRAAVDFGVTKRAANQVFFNLANIRTGGQTMIYIYN